MRLFQVSLQQFPTCCEKRRSLSPWLSYFILAMWFNHADNFKAHITMEIQTSCKDISKEITISKTFWTKWLAIRLVERIQQFLPERSFRKDLLATNVFPAHHFRRTIDLQRLRLNLSELSPQACASTIMRSQSKMVCNPWTNDPSLRWRSSEGDHRWCLIHRETVSNGEGSGILKTSSNCQLNLSIGLRIDCSLAVDRKTRPETNDFDAFLLAEAGLMPMMTMTWILFWYWRRLKLLLLWGRLQQNRQNHLLLLFAEKLKNCPDLNSFVWYTEELLLHQGQPIWIVAILLEQWQPFASAPPRDFALSTGKWWDNQAGQRYDACILRLQGKWQII